MWMSMPTPVTNSSQTADSGSSRKPASALNSAVLPEAVWYVVSPVSEPSHVYITFSKGLPCSAAANCVYWYTDRHAHRNANTTTPTQIPFTHFLSYASSSFLPKKNMHAAPKAGNNGTNQMCSRKNILFSLPVLAGQTHYHFKRSTSSTFTVSLLRKN